MIFLDFGMLRVEVILPLVLSFGSRFWELSIPGGKSEAGYLLRSAAQRGTWFPHPLYRSTRSTFDPCAFMAHPACEFSSLTKLGCGSNDAMAATEVINGLSTIAAPFCALCAQALC